MPKSERELSGPCVNCGYTRRKLFAIGSAGAVICSACARAYGLLR